jgi:hypothetical protein
VTTLSARYVRNARKRYICDWCERPIISSYIRLYGNSDNEPMWTLRLHPTAACCSSSTREPKIASALALAEEERKG